MLIVEVLMGCSMLFLAGYPSTGNRSSDEQVDEVSNYFLVETWSRSTSKIKFESFSVYLESTSH
jgi:hypothetical protein